MQFVRQQFPFDLLPEAEEASDRAYFTKMQAIRDGFWTKARVQAAVKTANDSGASKIIIAYMGMG